MTLVLNSDGFWLHMNHVRRRLAAELFPALALVFVQSFDRLAL